MITNEGNRVSQHFMASPLLLIRFLLAYFMLRQQEHYDRIRRRGHAEEFQQHNKETRGRAACVLCHNCFSCMNSSSLLGNSWKTFYYDIIFDASMKNRKRNNFFFMFSIIIYDVCIKDHSFIVCAFEATLWLRTERYLPFTTSFL